MSDPMRRDDDEEEVPCGTGLCCFFHDIRKCGPDCMAYSDNVPEGPDYRTPDDRARQWAFCMLLVNVHKMGKHLVHIANLMKSTAGDAQRLQQAPQPFLPPLVEHIKTPK